MYDCLIIGGGVIGCSILRELSKYNCRAVLLDACDDVSCGASRANSGINHSGFDCKPNTKKAYHNVRGNKMMANVCQELNVPYLNCGSIVVCDKDNLDGLKKLQQQGYENGVHTVILSGKNLLAIEPNIADNIEYGLFAPTAGIISPYKLTIASADYAITNGAEIFLNQNVCDIKLHNDIFSVITQQGVVFSSKTVINCAGTNGSKINEMAGAEKYETIFRRGEYFLLDKSERKNINTVIFPLPTDKGKGILVAPTVDGNVIYGPTAINQSNDSADVTQEGLDNIKSQIKSTYKNPNFKNIIRVYSGVRSIIGDDFVIGYSKLVKNFYQVIGICSPGLTASPSIADSVAQEISTNLQLSKRENLKNLQSIEKFSDFKYNELNEKIKSNPMWGNIVCRCEKVCEAEIVRAIHSPLKAKTIDAIKRRTRAGMGRCQGGFCMEKVMEILSRELCIPYKNVCKGGKNTFVVKDVIKGSEYEL